MECLLPAKWETYTGWFTAGPLEGVRRRNSVWGLRRYAGTAGSARSLALRNTASCRNTRAACAGACRIRYLRLRRAPYIFRYSLTHRTNVTSPVLNRNTRPGGGGGGGRKPEHPLSSKGWPSLFPEPSTTAQAANLPCSPMLAIPGYAMLAMRC